MQPMNNFMGFLFRSGAMHEEHSILVLCGPESPARRLLERYLHLLEHLDDPHWLPMTQGQEWAPFRLALVFDAVLRMVGQVLSLIHI
eukprot:7990284-Alexandrium_andersonii.AAC.1